MPEKNRYFVEGVYPGGNGGYPVTADYVVATGRDEAEAIVKTVRTQSDDWVCDRVVVFEHHINLERRQLARMESMTLDDVENNWSKTKADLYYEEEEEEEGVDV